MMETVEMVNKFGHVWVTVDRCEKCGRTIADVGTDGHLHKDGKSRVTRTVIDEGKGRKCSEHPGESFSAAVWDQLRFFPVWVNWKRGKRLNSLGKPIGIYPESPLARWRQMRDANKKRYLRTPDLRAFAYALKFALNPRTYRERRF